MEVVTRREAPVRMRRSESNGGDDTGGEAQTVRKSATRRLRQRWLFRRNPVQRGRDWRWHFGVSAEEDEAKILTQRLRF